jgi:hypothetical protein
VRLEERLPLGVVGSGLRRVVPLGAVDLHDESLLGPAEIGDDATAVEVHGDVDVGAREAAGEDEIEDTVLELRAGRGRP